MKTLLLVLAGAAALTFAYRRIGHPLEGTVWDVQVRADSAFAFARRDTLIFQDGRLTSARWAGEGFAPAGYEAPGEEGGTSSWGAALSRNGQGTVLWQGIARGDRIEGTLQRTAADGRTRRYRFKGVRKDG
jgi:hypothetical protein